MRRLSLALLVLAMAVGRPATTLAQEGADAPPATLIADRVVASPDGVLVASGSVEVFYDGRRLTASEVSFDQSTGRLRIKGPIRLTSGDGIIVLANEGELSEDLQTGILKSARLVLDQQLQLASAEIQRVSGRYTQLYKTVASSCEVCEDNPVPLWQIRARSIIHDQEERQLYFEDAQFRVLDVPVLYLPRLRLPDPTLERATGFLFASLRTTQNLGTGIRVPYFIKIDEVSDVTLTPYVTTENSQSLEVRYRRAFVNGDLSFLGAYTSDELEDGNRGFAILDGTFDLEGDYNLTFNFETVSDKNYYRDYGYDEKDRIDSNIAITRTRTDDFLRASAFYFTSFRENEDNDTLPRGVLDGEYQYRFDMPGIGGTGEFDLSLLGLRRPSEVDIEGRDTIEARLNFDWRRSWALRNGMIATAVTQLKAEQYAIQQDSTFPSSISTFTPSAAGELRWPLRRTTAGAQHILEPIVQLIWTDPSEDRVPLEDVSPVEFDEASLFDLTRFTETERSSGGWQANVGGTWTRINATGWTSGVTVGRLFLQEDNRGNIPGIATDEPVSDWLTTLRFDTPYGLEVLNRIQYSDDFRVNKNAFRLGWRQNESSVSATYTWLRASEVEDRPRNTNEILLTGTHRLNANWFGEADYRYDFEDRNSTEADLALTYQNECLTVRFSLSHRFSNSDNLRSTTDFGINVSLDGFGTSNTTAARRKNTCRG